MTRKTSVVAAVLVWNDTTSSRGNDWSALKMAGKTVGLVPVKGHFSAPSIFACFPTPSLWFPVFLLHTQTFSLLFSLATLNSFPTSSYSNS